MTCLPIEKIPQQEQTKQKKAEVFFSFYLDAWLLSSTLDKYIFVFSIAWYCSHWLRHFLAEKSSLPREEHIFFDRWIY